MPYSSSSGAVMTMPLYRSSGTSATRLSATRYSSTYSSYTPSSTFSTSTRPTSLISSRSSISSHEPLGSHYSRDKDDYRSLKAKTFTDLSSPVSGLSSTSSITRRYTAPRRYGLSTTPSSSPSLSVDEVTSEPRQSVDELRRRFDSGRSVNNLNNPASANTNQSSIVEPQTETFEPVLLEAGSADSDSNLCACVSVSHSRIDFSTIMLSAMVVAGLWLTALTVSTVSFLLGFLAYLQTSRKARPTTVGRMLGGASSHSSVIQYTAITFTIDKDSSLLGRTGSSAGSALKPTEKSGLNGLRNIGNTCFMNSVIQCLSNTKPLLEYLVEDDYLTDINMTVSSMKGALIKAFANVVQELWAPRTEDKIINTTSFKSQIQRFAPRFMGYAQQDAQEFLRYLLEGLHEDVNRVQNKPKPITTDIDETLSDNQKANEAWKRYLRMDDSKIMDIFVGQLKSTLQCTVCGHCSVTFDPFWDLSLPLPSRSGQLKLQACLDMFAKEEVLDGDEKPTCSKCQTRRKCTKKFSIQKFPKILVLHLKRFSPTERFRGKLSNCVEFPLTGLDMSPYVAGKGLNCVYNLYAVSNHSGTTYGGHYTAYCRHPYTKAWHEYNDSRVSTLSTRSIVSSEAYVLFYQLCSQTSHL